MGISIHIQALYRDCSKFQFSRNSLTGCLSAVIALAACSAQAADISWTGPANGQWHVGDNWSGGTVPEPADNVTISGANVTVSDVRQIDGSFTLSGGALFTVAGSGSSFVATGPTQIDNSMLNVGGGALLDLSQATEYAWTDCSTAPISIAYVSGAGSVLDLSGLQTFTVDVDSCEDISTSIFSLSGGLIDFGGLETISAPGGQKLGINLLLGGAISAPNLMEIVGPGEGSLLAVSFIVGADVDANFPALTTITSTTISTAGGVFTADALTEANYCLFSPAGDDTLSLDSLQTMRGGGLTVPTTGRVTLPELVRLSDTFVSLADDSVLNVPKLTVVEGTEAATSFTGSGAITLNAPLLTSARNVVFVVTSLLGAGSTLNLSSLRTYTWDLCEGGVPFTTGGAGALLDVSGLQTFSVTNTGCLGLGYPTGATGGSRIDLSDLTTISAPLGQSVSFFAANPNTVIDLSSLVHFNAATVLFFESDSGRIIRFSGGGGEGEGEGEGEGKTPGCGVARGESDFGSWGPGDTVLVLGLLALIGLSGRRRSTLRTMSKPHD